MVIKNSKAKKILYCVEVGLVAFFPCVLLWRIMLIKKTTHLHGLLYLMYCWVYI